jgi:hypothetical protein
MPNFVILSYLVLPVYGAIFSDAKYDLTRSLFFRTETARNSGGTASRLLFFRAPERAQPSISAEYEAPLAVNFREKQRKTAKRGRPNANRRNR